MFASVYKRLLRANRCGCMGAAVGLDVASSNCTTVEENLGLLRRSLFASVYKHGLCADMCGHRRGRVDSALVSRSRARLRVQIPTLVKKKKNLNLLRVC